MKHKDGKPIVHPDKKSKVVSTAIMLVALCGLSFYLGGIFCSDKDRITSNIQKAINSPKESSVAPLQIKSITFPECGIDYQDYTPCTDPRRWRKYGTYRLTLLERHCPPLSERKECLVPPPDGYKPPIRWPKSRDESWYRSSTCFTL